MMKSSMLIHYMGLLEKIGNSNPKTLGFDPLAGQGKKQVSCLRVSSCVDLFICVQHSPCIAFGQDIDLF